MPSFLFSPSVYPVFHFGNRPPPNIAWSLLSFLKLEDEVPPPLLEKSHCGDKETDRFGNSPPSQASLTSPLARKPLSFSLFLGL